MISKIIAVLLGFVFGTAFAFLLIVKHIKKAINKKAGVEYLPYISQEQKEQVEKIIKDREKAYVKSSRKKAWLSKIKRKTVYKIDLNYGEIITETAKVFNPDSQFPILELSETQTFEFFQTVIDRMNKIFVATELPLFDTLTISTALSYTGMVLSVAQNGAVKTATTIFSKVSMIINFLNPYYWIKKFINKTTYKLIIREAVYSSIEIVAKEFANLYGGINSKK